MQQGAGFRPTDLTKHFAGVSIDALAKWLRCFMPTWHLNPKRKAITAVHHTSCRLAGFTRKHVQQLMQSMHQFIEHLSD